MQFGHPEPTGASCGWQGWSPVSRYRRCSSAVSSSRAPHRSAGMRDVLGTIAPDQDAIILADLSDPALVILTSP